jgi:hypothetical protein
VAEPMFSRSASKGWMWLNRGKWRGSMTWSGWSLSRKCSSSLQTFRYRGCPGCHTPKSNIAALHRWFYFWAVY